MVIMASGIARGRVRTTAATTTTESRNMPCIRLARRNIELTRQDSAGGKKI